MPKYLVAGTGVGKAIVYGLLKEDPEAQVTIADATLKGASRVIEWLNRVFDAGSQRCEARRLEVSLVRSKELVDFDAIISALPAKYNYRLAKEVIGAGVHFCDLGGVVEVTQKMLTLDSLAKDADVSVVPDCGLAPGLALILTRALMYGIKESVDLEIVVGGIPQKPQEPLNYNQVFNLEGLRHICYDQSPVLRNGETILLPPFSEPENMIVPELVRFSEKFGGEMETFITAGASIAPYTYKNSGVRNLVERTLRWPGFVEILKDVPEKDFYQTMASYLGPPTSAENPDLVFMRVSATVTGQKSEHWPENVATLLDLFDEETGLSAMERTTGFPTAILATKMAQGKLLKGVNPADGAFPNKELINWYVGRIKNYFSLQFEYF